jgi:hypothetical protein
MNSTKHLPTAQLIPVSADPTATSHRVLFLFPGYLLLLIVAETLVIFSRPQLGLVFYGIVLLLLLAHTILSWNQPFRYIPLLLALAPVTRIFLLLTSINDLSLLYAILSLALPAIVASTFAIYLLRRSQSAVQQGSSPTSGNSSSQLHS